MIIVSRQSAANAAEMSQLISLVAACGETALPSRRLRLRAIPKCLSAAESPTGLPLAYRLDTPSPR